ncbi:hypothetical protein JXB31_00035 [Candidatus Woesearchaeota archaeon]|nr:hypothetical protein [Candidatus Woesearchaeota archaeon]
MDASIDGRISRRDFIKYMSILSAGVGAGLNPFKAYGKEINGVYVDDTTVWTPEKLDKAINSNDISMIHWRMNGVGNNEAGDYLLELFCKDFCTDLNNLYQVEFKNGKYNRDIIAGIGSVLGRYNKGKFHVPTFSLFGKGHETRFAIELPLDEHYNKVLKPNFEEWVSYLKNEK